MTRNPVKDPIEYWNDMRLGSGFSCPNVSLFRFLGQARFDYAGKNVLEIGFGANRGEDLLECRKRGAKVFGVDISRSYVEEFRDRYPDIPSQVMNAGREALPFETNYDLVFHRDVIYYLSDDEIRFHFHGVFERLNPEGYFAFQFIEKDLFLAAGKKEGGSYRLDFNDLLAADDSRLFAGEGNPIRTLDIDWLIAEGEAAGFKLRSTKSKIESYTPDETVYRVDRYILFQK